MGGRLFAVGDIHGCRDELECLLEALPLTKDDRLVFVGDYVDRGPDSAGVVELLTQLAASRARTTFLRGNHEAMLLGFLDGDDVYEEAFLLNGGRATAASYGINGRVTPAGLRHAMPDHHIEFLRATTLYYCRGRVVCVHAGLRPGIALEDQHPDDLLWIREEFLRPPHGFDATVVFGHTPHREILAHVPGKLGIDTGCVYGGQLSAVELPARRAYQVRRGQRRIQQVDLPTA